MVVLVALSPRQFAIAEFFSQNDYDGRSRKAFGVMHRESESRDIFSSFQKDKKLTKIFFLKSCRFVMPQFSYEVFRWGRLFRGN